MHFIKELKQSYKYIIQIHHHLMKKKISDQKTHLGKLALLSTNTNKLKLKHMQSLVVLHNSRVPGLLEPFRKLPKLMPNYILECNRRKF